MPTCIYCLELKPASGFRSTEHVLPQCFGRFRDNLTLHGVVCDECNQLFGNTIDLHLARDTPDGLSRYLVGGKDPEEFEPPRRGSSGEMRVKSGPHAGAFVVHRPGAGPRDFVPLPQVGFGKSEDGPFEWFKESELPAPEQIKALLRDGFRHVLLVEIADPARVNAELRARGANVSDVIWEATMPPGGARFEWAASLGMEFGRAIAKIAFNYLAHEYGAGTALMAGFDAARRFVRHGGQPDERPVWSQLRPTPGSRPLAHSIAIRWTRIGGTAAAAATVSFHHMSWYGITLGTELLIARADDRAHLFDLTTMAVRPISSLPDEPR